MFPILTVVKPVAALTSSIAVGSVIGTIIKSYVPTGASRLTRASFAVGTVVLTGAASTLADKFVMSEIDQTAATVESIKDIAKTVKSQ